MMVAVFLQSQRNSVRKMQFPWFIGKERVMGIVFGLVHQPEDWSSDFKFISYKQAIKETMDWFLAEVA